MKKKIVLILKKIYKKIPLKKSTKQKIKNILVKKIKFFRKIQNYNDKKIVTQSFSKNDIKFSENIKLKNEKKVAVHIHLFYLDLTEEFIKYLNNIPFQFDLYLSIADSNNSNKVKKDFQKIKNVKNVTVKAFENFGRDFGPMFVGFKKDLEKYDYLMHCHSKKSIRTGEQQDGWRNHMMDNLLGSEDIVKQIFNQFENDNKIGLIYPETFEGMPYWAHTWLYNRSNCNNIATKLGFTIEDEYIDYSVGSFFWVKIKAIKNFLDFDYNKNDFGDESGKADGTLAHAIERMIPQVVMANNYKYLVIDKNTKSFRLIGLKNMYQYNEQNKENILKKLLAYEVISFDIFDTLITRKIYSADNLFDLLSDFVQKKYKINDFKQLRKNAEYNVRVEKGFVGDCSIDEIYSNIEKITNLKKKETNIIKEYEKQLEIDFTIPREDMLYVFNKLKENKKNIILISDMYLDEKTITKMLNKCGYNNWNKLYLSSKTGFRKDNGEIWNYYFNNEGHNVSFIHVGDDEHADIQRLCDMAKPFIHVMQGKKMYKLTDYSKFLASNSNEMTFGDKVALGLIVNKKLFNSPFKFYDNDFAIANYNELGYFLGPLFLKFFSFLTEEVKKRNNKQLLFLAREGYYLRPLYKEYCKFAHENEVNSTYFLTSRRSTSVANITSLEDIDEILKSGYEGSLKNLFITRLGIDIDIKDKFIKLDESKEEVKELIKDNFSKYIDQFKKEKDEYVKYCKKEIKSDNVAVVDLGYSGTIQYYLMKLLNKRIDGYYFILNDNIKPIKIGGYAVGCYNSQTETLEKNIYNFSMIIETFLTAPFGQLIKFEKGKPIYRNEEINEELFRKFDTLIDGIKEFFQDYFTAANKYDMVLSNEFIASNLSSLVYTNILSSDIKKDFALDNSYSLDSVINVFDYLELVYIKNHQ